MGPPVWTLVPTTEGRESCDMCGWLIDPERCHYRSRHGSKHCQACHRPGQDWARLADSETLAEYAARMRRQNFEGVAP